MGTVGLSFGSPTSGAGFDVSTTVSEIVSNLQNVETPWKTQLTSLESQDTAISSLGTLFSNLSNDISSLTDAQGILAQKTGSSSNTDVLELASATSSATAGTHTVVVNSLAQTSSGYLGEVSNSSAALSGSITLVAGSGTAQTFTLGAAPSSGATANTTYTGSKADTLSDLASSINSSGLDITANVESDSSGSWLSLTSGTSGAGGNIAVSNVTLAGTGQVLAYTGAAGTDASGSTIATTSTGTLPAIGSSDVLSGSISIQAGSGTATSVTMAQVNAATGGSTIGDLATYLQNNYASQFSAATTTGSGGTTLSLTALTSGSAGTLTVSSSLVDTNSSTLGYTNAVTGVDANLTIDGKPNIQSASNSVSNLIPGLTFQLLSASSAPVQVVIGNDNTDVESTVSQFVSDYNAAISALNTQEGNTSSGTAEPLFGSPTLSLLQQQLLSGLNLQNPSGYFNSVSSTAGTTLSGSMTISEGGVTKTIEVGAAPTAAEGGPAVDTIYTGSGSDANTLAGLAAAINAANTPLTYTDSGLTSATTGSTASDSSYDTGTVGNVTGSSDTLTGSLSITVGSGTAQTVSMTDVESSEGGSSLADLKTYINANSSTLGVTASIATNSDGSSSLSLQSATANTSGALTVGSSLVDSTSSSASLTYSDSGYTGLSISSGVIGTVANSSDSLSGSLSVTVGSGGTERSISMSDVDSSQGGTTLADLAAYITANSNSLGFNATTNSAGTSLTLQSGTDGTAGVLTVNSGIVDGIGATASVVTKNGESSLTLISSAAASSGALTVTSSLASSTPASLNYTDSGVTTSTTADSGTLDAISSSGDTLGGSITIGVGGGATRTITLNSSNNTLSGLMGAINSAKLGVTASLNSAGTALTLTSGTTGSAGLLNITSNLYDSSNSKSTSLDYTSSSDINSLTSLGISVNNNGSLSFDAASLDSLLNSDYSSVVGFFQNVDSWGLSFSTMLSNAGTSSSTGILALASKSNSNIESTLNAEISKEQLYISEQQSSLTAELNSANEIMQELPSQLQGVNELYSAITGYNQNSGG